MSLISPYAGAYLQGPGFSLSHTVPSSESYSGTTLNGALEYAFQEKAWGDTTEANLKIADQLTSPLGLYPNYTTANSFSGANLLINTPVYISESVTVDYSYSTTGQGFFSGGNEYLEFQDTHGTDLAGCSFSILSSAPSSGSQSCATPELLVTAGSEIAVNSSLGASILASLNGDTSSFNGTATLGPLQVYDLQGNLIDTIDLSSLVISTPEPRSIGLLLGGLIMIALLTLRRRYLRLL